MRNLVAFSILIAGALGQFASALAAQATTSGAATHARHHSGGPPPSSGLASPSGTIVMAGSNGTITDAVGNEWSITSGNTVDENGAPAGFSAKVSELAYVQGSIWQENAAFWWYRWNGWFWIPGFNPLRLNLCGYHLSFDWEANDFANSPIPGNAEWTTTLSAYPYSEGLRSLGNGDQEYYTDSSTGDSPFNLSDGALDINATYRGAGNTPGGGTYSYTSGQITTEGSFSQQYGYFEMRAELPPGVGMWPAFWLLPVLSYAPGNWPPELDVLEAFGSPAADGEGGATQAHWDVHSTDAAQQAGNWVPLPRGGNSETGFHTYGVLWTPQLLDFYIDGTEVAQTATPSDFTQQMYMIANLAVGGYWPGNATGENGTMKIDYMRAFSNDSAVPPVALQTISSPDGNPDRDLYGATAKPDRDRPHHGDH